MPDWLVVFIWFLLSLSVFYSGHLYSNDTVSKIESARNLIKHGSFEVSGYHGAWGIPVEGGKTYPHFSLGSILMMVPPVLLYETLSGITGQPLPKFIQSVFVSGSNVLYTALSGCLIFILLLYLGKSKRDAFIYANITIFCSEMLQYSSTGWSEPAALCWGLLGFAFLAIEKNSERVSRSWILWAVCAFLASLIRIEYIAFFLCFLLINLSQNKTKWKSYVFPFVIICSVMIAHMWFNYYRFESVFNFGYFGRSAGKNTSIITSGASSILDVIRRFFSGSYVITFIRNYISFGRLHWFWVCPLLALSPFVFFYKRHPLLIHQIFITACFSQIVIVAMGNNSWCWANRYLYTTFPFLLLPVFFLPSDKKRLSNVFKSLAIIGLIIAFFSTFVNYHYIQEVLVNKFGYDIAMWKYPSHIITAPFWLHVKLFPEQLVNTIKLVFMGNNLPAWETLRIECFDLWPVSLCGAGVNSYVAFGLWIIFIGMVILFSMKVLVPRFFRV
jgi:hypothetical protein